MGSREATAANSAVHAFLITVSVFDELGQTVASVNPLNETTTSVYDVAGRAVASVNPAGEVTTTVYDDAGRSIASVAIPMAVSNPNVTSVPATSLSMVLGRTRTGIPTSSSLRAFRSI